MTVVKSPNAQKIARPAINTLMLIDMLAIVMGVALLMLVSRVSAVSVLVGGLIFFIPNASFAWMSFRVMGARQMHEIKQRFYRAEVVKFTLTIGLFVYAMVKLPTLNISTLFAAYIVFWLIHQLAAFKLIGQVR